MRLSHDNSELLIAIPGWRGEKPKSVQHQYGRGFRYTQLLLLAGRLVQAEGYDGELSPAQWMALRYFARANPFSRTPSAFAEFQATTRGTASQAIKALEADGYLVRQRSKVNRRSVSLRLTSKGKKVLARDPFEVLVRAVDSLDAKERTEMHHTLHKVLTTVTASGAHRRFGVCHNCTYLGGEMRCNRTSASSLAFECLLLASRRISGSRSSLKCCLGQTGSGGHKRE
jgi:DNA-binding MarR family transcriptional regulator